MFVARPIGKLPGVLVSSPNYLARFGTPTKPSDLASHNCFDPSGSAFSDWEFAGPSGSERIRVSGTLRTNSTQIVRQAVTEGLGIAMLREYLVAENLKDGSLVRVLDDYALDERTIYLVYQKDSYRPVRMKIFAEHVTKRMAEVSGMTRANRTQTKKPAGSSARRRSKR
jgi:DNA-binding transcriptional LysR family regulator